MIEIKNSDDLVSPWVHFFLLGDTGSGKTSAIATFPYPILIVPKNEQSIMRLRGLGIPYMEVETPDEMNAAISLLERKHQESARLLVEARKAEAVWQATFEACERGIDGATHELVDAHRAHADSLHQQAWDAFPYQTLGVESLSHYTDLIIEALAGGSKAGAWLTGKMDQQKWGQLGAHLRNIQTRVRNLPVHAVFTALATLKENDAGVVQGGPLMSGAMAYKLPSACDVIGYCEEMPDGSRRIHFKKYKTFPARARVPVGMTFPDVIVDFSWEKVKGFFGG